MSILSRTSDFHRASVITVVGGALRHRVPPASNIGARAFDETLSAPIEKRHSEELKIFLFCRTSTSKSKAHHNSPSSGRERPIPLPINYKKSNIKPYQDKALRRTEAAENFPHILAMLLNKFPYQAVLHCATL